MSTSTNCISLESLTFDLRGHRSNNFDWYDFEARIEDAHFKEIGGGEIHLLTENLLLVLSNDQGIPLAKMDSPLYAEYVGGIESEYLGNVAFSGYKTFYFFKGKDASRYLVLADKDGKLLAHTQMNTQALVSWVEILNHLRSSSFVATITRTHPSSGTGEHKHQ